MKITLGPGIPMAAYYRIRLNEGAHDVRFVRR